MRRTLVPTVAVLAVIAQLALGVSGSFGLVLCIGADHAAIEWAEDDCCAAHGTVGAQPVATIERDCCSDIPLYSFARPLSDVPRSHVLATSILATSSVIAAVAVMAAPNELLRERGRPPSPPAIARSVVLRV
jgi:hypothetical protein